MDYKKYFLEPSTPDQRKYEALRAYCLEEGVKQKEIAKRFGYTKYTFQAIVRDFKQQKLQLFPVKKRGPKNRRTPDPIIDEIIALRKRNQSAPDIYGILEEKDVKTSISTIDRILKENGFSKLPRRAQHKRGLTKKNTIIPPKSRQLDYTALLKGDFRCQVPGIYLFVPYMLQLRLDELIQKSSLPETQQLSAINSVYSILALKLIGQERISQIDNYNLDQGFGFFAGLNVLPKPTTISTYSYNLDRDTIQSFMLDFVSEVNSLDSRHYCGKTINLDFHTIPHHGEDPPLDENWIASKRKRMKSALTLLAQDGDSRMLNYVNADINREDASDEILKFVDHWINVKGVIDETLVFDSKLTDYSVLKQLDSDGVKFITLRRSRGVKMIEEASAVPDEDWEDVPLDIPKRKYPTPSVYERDFKSKKHGLKLRELIIKDNGRKKPTFVITNNRDMILKELVTYYARRWRIENKIADLVKFFSINALSSPIMIRIQFDVVMTMIADTLYKLLAYDLKRFEDSSPYSTFSNFVNTTGSVVVEGNNVTAKMRKKAHTPILKSSEVFKKSWEIPWFGNKNLSYKWVA